MMISELYGKQIITNSGRIVGLVEDVILDFESGMVASLLLTKVEDLMRGETTALKIAKNSVKYARVKNISESIIVSES
ncbi:PRC-barrel domain-containing protein [Candidatus Marsarchaeota archaeon]|nr:PRC-barrel domain-containing protein [Candidatus Marsarchaeota archaeon]MCL5090003.1 PRC-barrel domain-containing protein [Candidatus Marsarchaeota archaeon]